MPSKRPRIMKTPRALLALALCLRVLQLRAELTDLEAAFVKVPSAAKARESLRYITSRPHVAGTPGDLHMARYVRKEFLKAGIPDVQIYAPKVLLSYPRSRSLTLLGQSGAEVYSAPLAETVRDFDSTSNTWWRNHTYNGYSPSGDVSAPLVYANFGTPDDFDALEAAGVSVSGSIVIVRYGQCFRGLKAMNAQKRGAVGLLIYSDPQQDGYKNASNPRPIVPDGPWRPADGVQRGSVQFNSLCAGDPMRAYLEGPDAAERCCGYKPKELMPAIPVLPVSYGDALPLLRSLRGPLAPDAFRGALALEYRLGPSEGHVHLVTNNHFTVGPVWNVIGMVPGVAAAGKGSGGGGGGGDRPVVLGNHRDAWVFGAVDPNSGTASMIEVVRGLGALLSTGWQPQRTIILCSWSGEEFGLLGSTAWGETNAEGLLANAIAYLNVDSAVSGSQLAVKATPSFSSLLRSTLEDVSDPNTGKTLLGAWSGAVEMLGSGSDYTVFLHHLGIAAIDFEFRNSLEDDYGVYHSIYDSFGWMEKWGDPAFAYHVTAAQLWGLLALRLAEADVLPFDLVAQAAALGDYLADLRVLVDRATASKSVDLSAVGEAIERFKLAAEAAAKTAALVERLDRSVAMDANLELKLKGRRAERGGTHSKASSDLAPAVSDLNDRLAFTERQFLSEKGLPQRKWFKHVLQAPGLYLGYAAESFPGVSQAVADGDLALAQQAADDAAARIDAAAQWLAGAGAGASGGVTEVA